MFFNYGTVKKPTSDARRYYQARNDLRTFHRDVPLLAIGQGNEEDLQEIAYTREDVFLSNGDQTQLATQLQRRICETPAALQYPSCATSTSNNERITGYVTPGRKQYWAMYPEFFIKSFTVTFEFSARNGEYKVCYRRGSPKPEEDDRNCRNVKPGEEPVVFRHKNPCHKYGLHDCYGKWAAALVS